MWSATSPIEIKFFPQTAQVIGIAKAYGVIWMLKGMLFAMSLELPVLTIQLELGFTRDIIYGGNNPTTNNRRMDIFSKGADIIISYAVSRI
jgi:hypothetical protein